MEILVWIFINFGITVIVSLSSILAPFRNLFLKSKYKVTQKIGQGLSCPMCTSFWVGILLSLLVSVTGNFLLDGFLASGTAWFLYCMVSGPCFNIPTKN